MRDSGNFLQGLGGGGEGGGGLGSVSYKNIHISKNVYLNVIKYKINNQYHPTANRNRMCGTTQLSHQT